MHNSRLPVTGFLRLLLAGLSALCLWGPFRLTAQMPAIRQFNLRQGLPQSEVSCLLEDSRGLIWAGTRGGGLVQFDGNSLRVFKSINGLSSEFISAIKELPDGNLLVVSNYGGIQLYDGKSFGKAIRGPESAEFLSAAGGENGRIFGIHNHGITAFEFGKNRSEEYYRFPFPVSRLWCSEMIGRRWLLVSTDSGLFSIDTKSKERSLLLGTNSHLGKRRITSCQVLDSKSAVIISADGSLAVLDFEQGWPLLSAWQTLKGFNLKKGEEIRFVVFGLGQYIKWVATNQNRLLSGKSGSLDFSRLNGMKTPSVSALLSDRNGTVWMGTMGSGILVKPGQSALSFSENPSLAYGRLNAVLKTRSGHLLCGGTGSGLMVSREGSNQSLCLFPETDIFSLGESRSSILAGTSAGIRLLRKNDFSQQAFFPGPGKTIRFHLMPDGNVLAGTFGNGIWLLEEGKKPRRLLAENHELLYPYDFLPLGNGEYYIPSNSGLWKFHPEKLQLERVAVPEPVPGEFFLGTRDLYGGFWFSTNEGLACLRGRKWSLLRVKDGLSSGLIYTLNADSVGNIWVGGGHGLDKIALDARGKIREIRNYGPEEGFDGYEANMRGSFTGSDYLYVCTIQGLFAMPVKEPILDPLPGKPEIQSFLAGRKGGYDSLQTAGKSWFLTGSADIHLKQQPDLLQFDFRCINPLYPSKIKYSHRLSGLEKEWSKPSAETRISVPGPGPGKYVFEVRSTYDGLNFSEPAQVEFTVSVPWYLGKFFVLPALLFAALLVVLYLNARRKSRPSYNFFRKDLRWSDATGQLMLLLFAVVYPLLPFLAARFDASVSLDPERSAAILLLLAILFMVSVLSSTGRRHLDLLLKLAFGLMVADSGFGVWQNSLSPFYAALLFSVSGLAFIIFSGAGPILVYSVFLNALAWYCASHIAHPLFHPVSFQIASAGLSVVLLVVVLARQSSEEKLLFAGKVVNDGHMLVLAFDLKGHLVYASRNLRGLTGYGMDDLGGKNWWTKALENPQDRKGMETVLDARESREVRLELKTAGGDVRVFRFDSMPLGQRLMVFMGEDISENEFLLYRFENLVENATDAIFQTDVSGRILYCNPESTRLLGRRKEELNGKFYSDFVPEEYRESVQEFYQQQLAGKTRGSYLEFPLQHTSGEIRWMAFQTSMLYKRGVSAAEGLLAIGRDITEKMEAERLISAQHKDIADSMTYASRIRNALQPAYESLEGIFTHFAVLDEPRDIIGGDFFWLGENDHAPVFVLGDCTGHGVPGAFMTTISMGLLREGVKEEGRHSLEELLGNFNRSVNQHLGQKARFESFDFAELAMISLDKEKRELLYISSGIGLYRVRGTEVTAFPQASRGLNFRYDYSGMCQRIPLEPGDVFYLFTDGVYDQIGGPQQKRFSKNRLLKLILESDRVSLEQGMKHIRKSILEWQGSSPQTDDRMMISFRI